MAATLLAAPAARRSAEMAASEEMAAMVAPAASWSSTPRPAAMAARPVIPEWAALAATLQAARAATAVTAATVGRLMAAARLVAMAVREVAAARLRAEAPAASWISTPVSAAMAALPVLPERAALVATLLADRAALAVTAATVGQLMAAARLVAMAVLEAALAEMRPEEMVASEEMAALVA